MNGSTAWLQVAWARFDEGDFAQAAELCQVGLKDHPDNGDLWQLAGASFWELGLLDDALHALETGSCLKPLNPLAQCSLAEIYFQSQQIESSRTILDHLATHADVPLPLLPRIARALGRLGDYAQALEVCQRVVAVRPTHHAAHFGIAFYRLMLGASIDDVIPNVRRAYELAPTVVSYRISLASLLASLHRSAEAYEIIRDVPANQVQCSGCVRRMVPIFRRLNDRERAISWARHLGTMHRARGGKAT